MGHAAFFLTAAAFCLIGICCAPPPDKVGPDEPKEHGGNTTEAGDVGGPDGEDNVTKHYIGHRRNHSRFTEEDVEKMRANCHKRGNCTSQSAHAKKTRGGVKAALMRPGFGGRKKGLSSESAERRLKKIYDAKIELYKAIGLSEFEPYDNGLFGGDMALNEQQAQRLIDRANGTENATDEAVVPLLDVDSLPKILGALATASVNGSRKKRSDMLALDKYLGNKWPSNTINFYIDAGISDSQKSVIKDALTSIASKVSCLKFVEANVDPAIEYIKTPSDTDPTICGWSPVGYQDDGTNTINLNFDSSICAPNFQGVVVHETLHALGFAHEHTRYDRDKFLEIDTSNIDPQSLDVYNKDDPNDYNPYCNSYDLLSIMHYDAYVGSIDHSKPVMIPRTDSSYYLPKMGEGSEMTATDAKLLSKMYCSPSTCLDQSSLCGWSACGDCATYGSICPKSCDKCE